MRGPTREELLKTPPPELRMSSKTTQAYLDLRRKILTGEYTEEQVIIPSQIEQAYQINNTTTQTLLMRLANEGLVDILPVKERSWPKNASLNAYRVAHMANTQKTVLRGLHPTRRELAEGEQEIEREILLLKIQYADADIAALLAIPEEAKIVMCRERYRLPDTSILAIRDLFLPFWFAEALPELEQGDRDLYELLQQGGRKPAKSTETVELIQASSIERVLFELSPDDPTPLLRVQRMTVDTEEHPLAVEFLTLKGTRYCLQYERFFS